MNLERKIELAGGNRYYPPKRVIEVRLSRSNIEELLKKLNGYPPGSSMTIERDIGDGDVLLRVVAEEDVEHYNSKLREERVRGIRGITFTEHDQSGSYSPVAVSGEQPGSSPGEDTRPDDGEEVDGRLPDCPQGGKCYGDCEPGCTEVDTR